MSAMTMTAMKAMILSSLHGIIVDHIFVCLLEYPRVRLHPGVFIVVWDISSFFFVIYRGDREYNLVLIINVE